MPIQSDFRPRLSDMTPLGAVPAASIMESTMEVRRKAPRISPPATFQERNGYRADFLGEFVVPLPVAVDQPTPDILPIAGTRENQLDYTNFSVVMLASRRMARFIGVNISGGESVSIERGSDAWFLDGRIPPEAQIGEDLYADNLLDRGHLVRREDPNCGGDAHSANEDTFHFTNCAPQMAAFNQKTWLSLKTYVLKNTRIWEERVTVFSGPVFRDDDPRYRGVRIPQAFWKVVAFLTDDGRPLATAYMIDQVRELGSLEAAFGAFRTYQRSVRRIEMLTDLQFDELSQYDGFSNEERSTGTQIESVLNTAADVRV